MISILNNITLLTANFNTPDLTLCMLKSFVKQVGIQVPFLVIDNSTRIPIPIKSTGSLQIIDNTNFKLVPNYEQVSANHAASLEYAMQFIRTKYVLLCDSDILFKPAIKFLLTHIPDGTHAVGECGEDSASIGKRLYPYMCIFDIEKKKHDKIPYFDRNRIMVSADGIPYTKTYRPNPGDIPWYDTGASFLQDIQKAKWNIHHVSIDNYMEHLKGASNHCLPYKQWLALHHELY